MLHEQWFDRLSRLFQCCLWCGLPTHSRLKGLLDSIRNLGIVRTISAWFGDLQRVHEHGEIGIALEGRILGKRLDTGEAIISDDIAFQLLVLLCPGNEFPGFIDMLAGFRDGPVLTSK